MTPKEFFGDWWKCIDERVLNDIVERLKQIYKTNKVYPHFKDVFKCFEVCPYNKLSVIILGQDPYPDGNATGVAFANNISVKKLSPSLETIRLCLEDSYNKDIDSFNPSLEEWAKQGVLLLNSSLTVLAGKPGSHTMLWRPFISSFIKKLGEWNPGLIYVLMGETAQTFEPYIGKFNDVIKVKHPAYYARTKTNMPNIFCEIDKLTLSKNNFKINWI